MGIYTQINKKSVNGKALSPDSPAVPCGLNAKSLFNDTFVLKWGTTTVPINEKNIAWQVDRDHRFSNTDGDWESVQWTDMENEHFIVWMRTAGLSTCHAIFFSLIGTAVVPHFKTKVSLNKLLALRPHGTAGESALKAFPLTLFY